MKPGLQSGIAGKLTWTVDASMVITLGGHPRATVFSTPNMILLMERAAREAVRPFLEPGEETVGTRVHVEHLAGARMGDVVEGTAIVEGVDGRRIRFRLEATSNGRLLGRGEHERAVVNVDRLIHGMQGEPHPGPASSSALTESFSWSRLTTLQWEQQGKIGILTLHRPKVLNAVDSVMTAELESVTSWLMAHPNEVRVVLLRGAGDAFCAGDDVKELQSMAIENARRLSYRQAELYLTWERLPQPIIALVHGDAMGGGCVAAYSCDVRIASHRARFGMPEIKLGWPPGYGLAQLTALVGKMRALQLCMTGRPIAASEALEWGLINETVPDSMLLPRGMEFAKHLLTMPADALRWTKRLIHLDEGMQPKVAYRADTEAYVHCLGLSDAQEGIRAFVEKRMPKFGRE